MIMSIVRAVLVVLALTLVITVVSVVGWVIKELIIWFWERRKKRDD